MKLTYRVLGIYLFGIACCLLLLLGVLKNGVLGHLDRIEGQTTRQDLHRAVRAFRDEAVGLQRLARDCAGWAAIRHCVCDPSPAEGRSVLPPQVTRELQLDAFIILSADGTPVVANSVSPGPYGASPLEPLARAQLLYGLPSADAEPDVVAVGNRAFMRAVAPIPAPERPHTPVGTLVLGRCIDQAVIRDLCSRTLLNLELSVNAHGQLPSGLRAARGHAAWQGPVVVQPLDEGRIAGHTVIGSGGADSSVLLQIIQRRVLYATGLSAYTSSILVVFVIVAGLAVLLFAFLYYQVLKPVDMLCDDVQQAEDSGKELQLQSGRLGRLAGRINALRDRLLASRQRVAEIESRFESIVRSTRDAVYFGDSQGVIIYWNQGAERIFGYRADEAVGMHVTELVPERLQTVLREGLQLRDSRCDATVESVGRRRDGTEIPIEVTVSRWPQGDKWFYGAIARDISARVEARETIKRQAQMLREAQRLARVGSWEYDFISETMEWSDELYDLLGYDQRTVAASMAVLVARIHPEDRTVLPDRAALQQRTVWQQECRYRRGDDTWRYAKIDIRLRRDDGGALQSMLGTLQDITAQKQAQRENRQLQEDLRRAEKMETIGLLAGGVAHDLNNILGAVVGYPELLLRSLAADSDLRQPLEAIKKSGDRAAAIVADMLALARRGVINKQTIDLNAVVRETLTLQEYQRMCAYHPEVEVQASLQAGCLQIEGSAVHLSKMAMNLLSNACEAIERSGTVRLRTSLVDLAHDLKAYEVIPAGRYAVLEIADSGHGMTADALAHIFEPFYTKKKMGRSGTGLGMAVVWGTLKDHNGYIDISSQPGHGTSMVLYLPLAQRDVPPYEDAPPRERCVGNGQTVLVVDDVADQCALAREFLLRLHYNVRTADSGEAALELLSTESFDALLLDMVMDPGIDGLETIEAVRSAHPHLPVVLMTGFADSERVRQALTAGAAICLKKPYRMDDLGWALRQALGGKD